MSKRKLNWWQNEELKVLKDLCLKAQSWRELRQAFEDNKDKFSQGRSWESVRARCRRHPHWVSHFANLDPPKIEKEESISQALSDFLFRTRTLAEIAKKFKIDEAEARALLSSPPDGYHLRIQQNEYGEDVFILLPNLDNALKVKERIWTPKIQPTQPYLAIEFPNDLRWKKLNIVPMADVDFGDPQHDAETFDEYINWISRTPHVFVFFNGNIFKKFSRAEADMMGEKVVELQNKLARIAHKILWAQAGTNEEANQRLNFDPLQVICEDFNIPYFTEPVYVDILWQSHIFTFFCIHGRSNAITKGGRLNAVIRPIVFQEFVMFVVMAHIKDKMMNKIIRICRNPQEFNLEHKIQYLIICPSFRRYFGSETARKGYRPFSIGTVSCRLYRDGFYRTSN
ncbi:hypothetical protein D6821_00130 [Candidatus Parcubacteria bacterium]|nr:MAG: hypothetical protein D6821_00130 [Candidatus Parcubacteria bacterium]